MKNILIIAIASLLFSCNDKDEPNVIPPPDNPTDTIDKINPAAVLSVRIDKEMGTKSLTYDARFITLYAWDYTLSGLTKDVPGYDMYWRNRDTVENKITFMGWDVIAPEMDSTYTLGPFISSEDIILRIAIDSSHIPVSPLDGDLRSIVDYDTVSYIPNTVMRKNQKVLDSLFNAKDYQSCYQMFDTAYHFIPITGAEWRKLKEEGIE